jgi:hypothetical protein
VRVSLGRVQRQVEIFRKVRHAPLATTATRTSSMFYLDNSNINVYDSLRKDPSKYQDLQDVFYE